MPRVAGVASWTVPSADAKSGRSCQLDCPFSRCQEWQELPVGLSLQPMPRVAGVATVCKGMYDSAKSLEWSYIFSS